MFISDGIEQVGCRGSIFASCRDICTQVARVGWQYEYPPLVCSALSKFINCEQSGLARAYVWPSSLVPARCRHATLYCCLPWRNLTGTVLGGNRLFLNLPQYFRISHQAHGRIAQRDDKTVAYIPCRVFFLFCGSLPSKLSYRYRRRGCDRREKERLCLSPIYL